LERANSSPVVVIKLISLKMKEKKKEKGNEGHWNTGARLKRRREQKEEE
jgi:hypothetical protein